MWVWWNIASYSPSSVLCLSPQIPGLVLLLTSGYFKKESVIL
jgi:hypothetical protein